MERRIQCLFHKVGRRRVLVGFADFSQLCCYRLKLLEVFLALQWTVYSSVLSLMETRFDDTTVGSSVKASHSVTMSPSRFGLIVRAFN